MSFDPNKHATKQRIPQECANLSLDMDECLAYIQQEDAEFYELHKQWREERKAASKSHPVSSYDDSLVIRDEPLRTKKPTPLITFEGETAVKRRTINKKSRDEEKTGDENTKSHDAGARPGQVLDLYYACNAYKDKDKPRPTLRIHDPHKDMVHLESRIVTQCEWIANVPEACLGFHKGCNQAIKALHALIGGPANINFKEKLCMNATGERYMVSKAMKNGVLHEYLHDPSS